MLVIYLLSVIVRVPQAVFMETFSFHPSLPPFTRTLTDSFTVNTDRIYLGHCIRIVKEKNGEGEEKADGRKREGTERVPCVAAPHGKKKKKDRNP